MPHTPKTHTVTLSRSKPSLEIIPDQRFIVFHGGEHEGAPAKLTGRVRLHAPEAMSILKPKIRLEGKRKVLWYYASGIATAEVVDKKVFWNQEHRLGSVESTHKVNKGIIEWPFEFELSPSMPESVEGLRETYIVYNLHASVVRPGWNAKDVMATEHIRIVRTLGRDEMETTRSRINADIWANKVSYNISIPSDAVVFGTSITADVELSPLKKGIRLGKVELRLLETVVKRIQASEVPDLRADRTKTDELEVAKSDMDFPEDSKVVFDGETLDNPTMADEMYKFKATLPLPKSLNICRQSVDSHQIDITHRFKLMVNIHNPEGHVSQLVCRLPVKLFISPNLPVDEANEVHPGASGISDAELNNTEAVTVAPPEYGRHQLDQIYSDIDPSGFMSSAGSAAATPAGLMAQSRRGSHDFVLSLNGLADGDPALLHHGSATPHLLHSRLADLQVSNAGHVARNVGIVTDHSPSGGTSPAPGPSDAQSRTHSPERNSSHHLSSPPAGSRNSSTSYFNILPSSHTSQDDALASSAHRVDYNLTDLSRVPSYGVALRTPTGTVTPFTEGPPSYVEATSRPPSPTSRQTLAERSGSSSQASTPPLHAHTHAASTAASHGIPSPLHAGSPGVSAAPIGRDSRPRILHARN